MHEEHHHHSHNLKGRPLLLAVVLNLLITLAQVVGGLVAGSLSLLGDALHNFSDVLSLLLSYFANKLSHRNQDVTKTFGYKRAQILAAFINALTLIGVSVFLIIQSIERFFITQVIASEYVIFFALAGILVNGGSALMLIKHQKGDSNMRSAYLHLMADMATSFAVLAGGLAMYFFQVFWVDGVITILVAFYLIYMSAKLFLHTAHVLMQFVPAHLKVEEICATLRKNESVLDIHHVHIWRINDDSVHFEAHVLLRQDMSVSRFEVLKNQLSKKLYDEFEINHAIFQPEFTGCTSQDVVAQE